MIVYNEDNKKTKDKNEYDIDINMNPIFSLAGLGSNIGNIDDVSLQILVLYFIYNPEFRLLKGVD